MTTCKSTIIVSSFSLRRDALEVLLTEAGFHLIGKVGELRNLRSLIDTDGKEPALILVDSLAWTDSELDTAARLRSTNSNTKIVVLAESLPPSRIEQLRQLGVEGLLTPDIHKAALVRYLELVLLGERVLHPGVHAEIQASGVFTSLSTTGRPARLSAREHQVLRLVARGLSNKQMARRLEITDGTVKIHVRNLCRKVGARNRTQLAAWAVTQGISDSARPNS